MTWELPVAVVVGIVVGLVGGWYLTWPVTRVLRTELDRARKAEELATDRLVHAWKEGAQIPPRPTEPGPPLQPLPQDLADHVDQWDDPEHKAELEGHIRALQARGLSSTAILMHLDNEHP